MLFSQDPSFNRGILAETKKKLEKQQFLEQGITPDLATAMGNIVQRGPHIPPEMLKPLARAGISNNAVDLLNQTIAVKNATEKTEKDDQNWLQRNIIDKIEGVAQHFSPDQLYADLKYDMRWLQAAGSLGADVIPNLMLMGVTKLKTGQTETEGWYSSSRYAQFLKKGPNSAGQGFSLDQKFLDDQYMEEWNFRSKQHRGLTSYGDPTTVGRTWAEDILGLDYKGTAGFLVSGTIDATISALTDPTNVLFAAGKAINTVKYGVKTLRGIRIAEETNRLYESGSAAITTATKLEASVRESGSLRNIFRLGKEAKVIPDTANEFAVIEELRQASDKTITDLLLASGHRLVDGLPVPIVPSSASIKTTNRLLGQVQAEEQILQLAEQNVWDTSRAMTMLRTTDRGVRLVNKIADLPIGPAAAHRIRRDIFKGKISLEQAEELARAVGNRPQIEAILMDAFNRVNSADAVMPLTLDKLTKQTFGLQPKTWLNGFKVNPVPEKIQDSGWILKHFGVYPNQVLDVMGSSKQRMDSVDNFAAFIDKALPNMPYEIKLTWIDKMMKSVTYADFPTGQIIGGVVQDVPISGGSATAAYKVDKMVETLFGMSMSEYGIPSEVAEGIIKKRQQLIGEFRRYALGESGFPNDFDQVTQLEKLGLIDLDTIIADFAAEGINVTKDEIRNIGPGLVSDLFNRTVVLPDMDKIAGIAKNPYFRKSIGALTRHPSGELVGESYAAVKALDYAINTVWKAGILGVPSYLFRNLIDGHIRIALSGHTALNGVIKNPMEWALWVGKRKGVTDIFGRTLSMDLIDELAAESVKDLSEADKTLLGVANAERWILAGSKNTPTSTMQRYIQDGSFRIVTKADVVPYSRGTIDQLRKIAMSSSEQMYARFAHIPNPVDRAKAMLRYLYSKEGAEAQQELLALGRDGLSLGTQKGPLGVSVPVEVGDAKSRLEYLKNLINTQINGRVHQYSDIPELRAVILTNRIPVVDPSTGRSVIQSVPFTNDMMDIVYNTANKTGKLDSFIGGTLPHPSGIQYFIHDVTMSSTGPIAHLMQLVPNEVGWATNGETRNYGDAMISFVSKLVKNTDKDITGLPDQVLEAARRLPSSAEDNATKKMIQKYIDVVFQGQYEGDNRVLGAVSKISIGRSTTALEKLPTFRMLLWDTYLKNLKSLSYDEAVKAKTYILETAVKLDMTPNNVMGGTKGQNRFEELLAIIDRGPNSVWGNNSVESLDQYAYALADSTMRGLFFDAATKTNFDQNTFMKLMFQFASAQKTALQGLTRAMIKNPQGVYKAKRTLDAGYNADRPGPRAGFFYKDPATGQYLYTVPLSGAMATGMSKLINIAKGNPSAPIGPPAGISAPIKGINLGFQWVPSLGPIGTFSASYLLPHVPGGDFLKKLFLGRGATTGTAIVNNLIPTWAKKTFNLLESNPERVSQNFGQNYVETLLALSTTGDYDFKTPEKIESEWQRLQKDAITPAQAITSIEILTGVLGPATGKPDFLIGAKNGPIYLSQIATELQKLRDQNYESAIPKFLRIYGEELMLFVSGKTSNRDTPGIQMTGQFLDWQVDNTEFFKQHQGVASYFGPAGDTFSWAAFSYQLQKGYQYRLKPADLKDASDYAIGAAKYREQRSFFPTYLSDEQQKALSGYRAKLHEEYPGYPPQPKFDVGRFPDFLSDLERAAKDPLVSSTPIAKTILEYIDYRKQALDILLTKFGLKGFRSKQAVEFRVAMIEKAYDLIEQNPEFARVYDRQLSSEVEFLNEDLVDESRTDKG
jgi:hypothetical protein